MAKIKSKDFEVGMVLSKPVYNMQCKLLIANGTCLEAKHIRLLKVWGIQEISVVSEDDQKIQQELTEKLKIRKNTIELMFSDIKNNPVMKLIKDIAIKQQSAEVQEESL